MAAQSNTNDKGEGLRTTADGLLDAGSRMGAVAVDKIEDTAESAKDAGLDQVRELTDTAARVADDLQEKSPLIAQYVRDAARRVEHIGDALHDKSVGQLLSTATEYGRKQPLLFFAGAAVLGFALSRVVRSGLAEGAKGPAGTREAKPSQSASDIPASSGDTSSYGGASYAGGGSSAAKPGATTKPAGKN